jgi:hypothetical protein
MATTAKTNKNKITAQATNTNTSEPKDGPAVLNAAAAHLIVVRKVEVAAEPRLDLGVGADGVDEALGGHRVVVVQPAASVHDVAFLKA